MILKEEYDKIYDELGEKSIKLDRIKEIIKAHYEIIDDTKCNHLILADKSEYHRHRFIVEKEKLDLLDELIKELYEIK